MPIRPLRDQSSVPAGLVDEDMDDQDSRSEDGTTHPVAPRDVGATLVEMMVAMLLMAVAIAAVLPAMWVAVRASETSNSEAETIAVLTDASNRLTRSGWTVCPEDDGLGSYEAVVDAAAAEKGWGASALTIASVRYWEPSTQTWGTTNPLEAGGCLGLDDTVTADQSLQRVVIDARSPDGKFVRSLEVVIGDMSGQVTGDGV